MTVDRLSHADFAKFARLEVFDTFPDAVAASGLRAVLDHSAVLASEIHQQAAFVDGVAERFFHVHILACDNRCRGDRHVPMVGRCDGDDIDGFVFEHPAIVPVAGDLFVAVLVLFYPLIQDIAVYVAQRDDPHAFEAVKFTDESVAPAANACDADANITIGTPHFGERQCQCCTDHCGTFYKISACKVIHCQSPFTLRIF
ncbi:hypothetical protein ES707_12930 [subsurface metagenome]